MDSPTLSDSSNLENRSIQLLHRVASSANMVTEVEESVQFILDEICGFMGWPLGHAYLWEKQKLISTKLWSMVETEKYQSFKEVTEKKVLGLGIGLPGRVLSLQKAVWIVDVTQDKNFPRVQSAEQVGLRSGVAFPVVVGTQIVAVLEFFSDKTIEPNEELLGIMTQVGTQLGRVFERKMSYRALQDSELRFRSVTESANDAIVSADEVGKIIYWNRAAQKIFGYEFDEIIGRDLSSLMPERYRSAHKAGMERLRQTGETRVIGKTIELHGLRKNGIEFPLELSLSTWKTKEGTFFTGIIRDITERKDAESVLKQKTFDLERSNKELQQFAYVASHDLQEPLRMIAGFSQLLEQRHREQMDPGVRENVKMIIDSSKRMHSLISDLLDYSRVGATDQKFVETRCDEVLDIAIKNLGSSVRESGAVIKRDLLPVIVADAGQLRQLFQNLLANAIKFTSQRPDVFVGCRDQGDRWQFFVKDNGIGIDPEYFHKIFLIFQRLHGRDQFPGTGIGLAICKKVVEQHQGEIWVESSPGRGATFFFTISKNLNPTAA
jgi:PAS domain S-box-containing protein